jgi:hypothetical protein
METSIEKSLDQIPMLTYGDLKIALLTDNLVVGQEISTICRLFEVYPFYYQKLSDLWQLLMTEEVDLVIVDIAKVEESGLALKDHPVLSQGKTFLGIFFDPKHKSMLGAATSLPHLGYVNRELSLSVQLKGMLNTILHIKQLQQEIIKTNHAARLMQHKVDAVDSRMDSMTTNLSKMIRVVDIVKKFQTRPLSNRRAFTDLLDNFLDSWKLVRNFSMVSLNESDQKLFSPTLKSPKSISVDPFWLAEPAQDGIHRLAREALLSKAYDTLGVDVIVLEIKGVRDYPEMILFIKVEEEKFTSVEDGYHWILLEQILNNLFKSAMISENKNMQTQEKFIPVWSAFDILDHNAELSTDTGDRLVNINFKEFTLFITAKPMQPFQWKSFMTDFLTGIQESLKGACKISTFGIEHVMVFLPQEGLELRYHMLKEYVAKFEYWLYFNPQNILIPREVLPQTQLVAADSYHYLRRYVFNELRTPAAKSNEITF